MKIESYRVQDELDSLVNGITEAIRGDVMYSEYVGDKITEMHKEAFSNMHHHVTVKEGRLCLYLSHGDDFDDSCFLDLEQELVEYIAEGDEHKDRLYSLVSRICVEGDL